MKLTAVVEAIHSLNLELEKRKKILYDLYHEAKSLHHSGCFAEAEEKYKKLLELNRSNATAWLDLGLIYFSRERYEEALEAVIKSLEINPLDAIHHYRFGLILNKISNAQKAIQIYQRLINFPSDPLNGHDAQAFFSSLDFIESTYQRTLKVQPDSIGYLRLGNVLMAQDKIDIAVETYEKALSFTPRDPVILNNLGAAFEVKNDRTRASLYFGYAFFYKRKYSEALLEFQEFLKTKNGDLTFYMALGVCHFKLKEYEKAVKVYRQGIELYPASSELYLKLIDTLDYIGKTREAISLAKEALYQFPEDLRLKYRSCLTLPALYRDQDEVIFYRDQFTYGLERVIRETPLDTLQDKKKALEAIADSSSFYLSYQGCNDRELQSKYGQLVHRIMSVNYPEWVKPLELPSLSEGGKIRVGYVSKDFRDHSVGKMVLGWLRHCDRQNFEVYCYHVGTRTDYLSTEFRSYSDVFHHIPKDLKAACKQIIGDELHILVFPEIGMSAQIMQMAGLRLAPVQCATWGHPVTSGLPTIDYYLSSDLMEPENAQEHYSEKLIRLPNIGMSYEKPDKPKHRKSRSDFGIPDHAMVYLSCQSLFKYLPRYDYIFAEIAKRVPSSLFLFVSFFDENIVSQFRKRLECAFAQVGRKSEEHCLFLTLQEYISYLNLHLVSDVFLDVPGWSGASTTLEAIAAGLPVVTLRGQFLRSRMAYGILKMLGVTQTIAEDEKDYIEIATRLGLDEEWRDTIRQKVINSHDRLFNDKTCVSFLEEFYRNTVHKRLQNAHPLVFKSY